MQEERSREAEAEMKNLRLLRDEDVLLQSWHRAKPDRNVGARRQITQVKFFLLSSDQMARVRRIGGMLPSMLAQPRMPDSGRLRLADRAVQESPFDRGAAPG